MHFRTGLAHLLEHNAIAYITADEIDGYDFCPADTEILLRIKAEHGGGRRARS